MNLNPYSSPKCVKSNASNVSVGEWRSITLLFAVSFVASAGCVLAFYSASIFSGARFRPFIAGAGLAYPLVASAVAGSFCRDDRFLVGAVTGVGWGFLTPVVLIRCWTTGEFSYSMLTGFVLIPCILYGLMWPIVRLRKRRLRTE